MDASSLNSVLVCCRYVVGWFASRIFSKPTLLQGEDRCIKVTKTTTRRAPISLLERAACAGLGWHCISRMAAVKGSSFSMQPLVHPITLLLSRSLKHASMCFICKPCTMCILRVLLNALCGFFAQERLLLICAMPESCCCPEALVLTDNQMPRAAMRCARQPTRRHRSTRRVHRPRLRPCGLAGRSP